MKLPCLLLLSTMSLTAHAATCNVSATPLAFGSYASPGGVQTDSSSTLTVSCTPERILLCTIGYTVSLSAGGAGSYAPRKLDSGGNRLDYNLYTSATRSTVWGDGTGGTSTVSSSITSGLLGLLLCDEASKNHTVYARIPAAQSVPAGSYADTIVVTVTY